MVLIEQRLADLCELAANHPPVYRTQIAASIYLRHKLISIGHNSYKTHPFQARFSKCRECIYLHAEVDAIKNALKEISVAELAKSEMYVARIKWDSGERRTKVQGLARPCEGCQRAIATFEIQEVFYTLDDLGYDML